MSTSIRGWIEIYLPIIEEWAAITNISLLVAQDYNAYGCLFGVRNYSSFVPIAPERGVPDDASEEFKNETQNLKHHNYPSWIRFSEIEAINWEESVIDAYVHVHKRLENGEYETSSSAGYVPKEPFDRQVGDIWVADGKDKRKIVLFSKQNRPTMRAADGGESARFTSIFLTLSFFCSQTFIYPRPLSAANASR